MQTFGQSLTTKFLEGSNWMVLHLSSGERIGESRQNDPENPIYEKSYMKKITKMLMTVISRMGLQVILRVVFLLSYLFFYKSLKFLNRQILCIIRKTSCFNWESKKKFLNREKGKKGLQDLQEAQWAILQGIKDLKKMKMGVKVRLDYTIQAIKYQQRELMDWKLWETVCPSQGSH